MNHHAIIYMGSSIHCYNPRAAAAQRWQVVAESFSTTLPTAPDALSDPPTWLAGLLQHGCSVQILIDSLDLEFRIDSLPQARPAETRAIVARRLERLFPQLPYRNAYRLGPDPQQAQRQLWVLHAPSDAARITALLAQLQAYGIPLVGIAALPLLSLKIFQPYLASPSERLIDNTTVSLIVILSATGHSRWLAIRRTPRQLQLIFTRLLAFPKPPDSSAWLTLLGDEINRCATYLLQENLLSPGTHLQPLIISNATHCQTLQDHPANQLSDLPASLHCAPIRWLNASQVFMRAGRKATQISVSTDLPEMICAWAARCALPLNHYANWAIRQRYYFKYARWGMYGLSVGLLAGALLLGSRNWGMADNWQQRAWQQEQQTSHTNQQFLALLERSGIALHEVPQMGALQQLFTQLEFSQAPLQPLLTGIAQTLEIFPQVHLTQLSWEPAVVQATDTALVSTAWPAQNGANNPNGSWRVHLKGDLHDYVSYRGAQELMEKLRATLSEKLNQTLHQQLVQPLQGALAPPPEESTAGTVSVSVITWPFELRAEKTLELSEKNLAKAVVTREQLLDSAANSESQDNPRAPQPVASLASHKPFELEILWRVPQP